MAAYIKFEQIAHGARNLLNARITKLKYLFAFVTNQVVVLFVFVGFFKLRQVLSELVFGNKATVEQKFNGVIEGGAAHTVFFILHVNVKRFNIEMTTMRIDLA